MRAERSSTVTVMNHILVRISIKSPSARYQLEPTPEKSDTPYHFRGYYYISTITHHCAPLWSIVYRILNSSTTYYLRLWLLPRITRSLIQERKDTFPSSWVHDLRAFTIALDISRNFYRIAVYIQPVSLSKFDSNNQTPFSPACILCIRTPGRKGSSTMWFSVIYEIRLYTSKRLDFGHLVL